MTDDRKKIIIKAKKLKALAERGVGGEKDNAQKFLDIYVSKHNITNRELSDEKITFELSELSDEEFLAEMIVEIIPISVGVLFKRFASKEQNDDNLKKAMSFLDKYLGEMASRASKASSKYKNNK